MKKGRKGRSIMDPAGSVKPSVSGVSVADMKAWLDKRVEETDHLLRSLANAEHLGRSIAQLRRAKLTMTELAEAAESDEIETALAAPLRRRKWSDLERFNRADFNVEAYNKALENGLSKGSDVRD